MKIKNDTSIVAFFFLLFAFGFNIHAQIIFRQDIFKGGMTGSGYSPSYNDISFSGIFNIQSLPLGSTIRKAYLFAGQVGQIEKFGVNFNGINYEFNDFTVISDGFVSEVYGGESAIHVIDVSDNVNASQSTYQINSLETQNQSSNRFSDFYLLVLYENISSSLFCSNIILNNQNFSENITYNLTNLNPINNLFDVGLSLFAGYICDTLNDGEKLLVNGINSGLFGGNNTNSGQCGGPTGDFDFYNSVLTGINDDNTTNNFTGQNVIKDIKSDVVFLETNLNLTYLTSEVINKTNSIWVNFLAYSSPCDTFTVSVTTDTTICRNSPLQLQAIGGIQYLWQPSEGLSCTDCPNPQFTGDSSQFYTVQIWNNDSCSVVLPVKINVRDLPQFKGIGIAPTLCGTQTGSLTLVAENTTRLPLSYALDVGAFVPTSTYTGIFSGLDSGTVLVKLKDGYGCVSDSSIFVGVNNPTKALFNANPNTGVAPLEVLLNNQSTSATNYRWFLNDIEQSSNFSNFSADTSGLYDIVLIAWQNDSMCADTLKISILVYDTLLLKIPNIFTPNDDGLNDVFGITSNIDISISYEIFNRWGNNVINGKITQEQPESNKGGFYPLWDGKSNPDGVYFYHLMIYKKDKTELIKKEGFVQLVK